MIVATIFTDEHVEFIKHNYPKFGGKYCAEFLGFKKQQIMSKIYHLGIKVDNDVVRKIKSDGQKNRIWNSEKRSVDPSQFFEVKTPEIAYILGILWADSFIYVNEKNSIWEVRLSLIKEDSLTISSVFEKTGYWRHEEIPPRNNGKPQLRFNTGNKPLVKFLINMDYKSKSNSPDKILALIPHNLRKYWFRGFLDGDGCVCKTKSYQYICFTGPIDQNWDFIKNLFNYLHITYSIFKSKVLCKKTGKIHKSSVIKTAKRDNCFILGNYIYDNYFVDNIGFPRKFLKFQSFIPSKEDAFKIHIKQNQSIYQFSSHGQTCLLQNFLPISQTQ